jgi:hypothetical protein
MDVNVTACGVGPNGGGLCLHGRAAYIGLVAMGD